jgi:hypothetical protein
MTIEEMKNRFACKWITLGRDTADFWKDLDSLIRAVREEDALKVEEWIGLLKGVEAIAQAIREAKT